MALLAVEHLNMTYPDCARPVLRDVSFSLEEGELAVLCGATGCGKTSLLRMLKRELRPLCTMTGRVLFDGVSLETQSARASAVGIGFVMQQPEQQIVTDRVYHELAFGLENLGTEPEVIRRKTAEIASYFGMEELLDKDPALLSGGQKQLLNLASVMIMQPRLLLLDEPTAQLDPIAASDFLTTLHRLNRDFSTTILLVEHRLEEVIPIADRLLLMEDGCLTQNAAPQTVLTQLSPDHPAMCGMPAPVRLFHAVGGTGTCPMTVHAARKTLLPQYSHKIKALPEPPAPPQTEPAVTCSGVYFRYDRRGRDVLRDCSLTVCTGEWYCLLGGNGAGKSTVLSLLSGLRQPYAGEIRVFGKRLCDYRSRTLHQQCVTLLPQDVQTVFLHDTVEAELAELDRDFPETLSGFPYDLRPLLGQHPYDLSGGQQQLAALAKAMLTKPRLLLLDEPTKGLDAYTKQQLAAVLHGLQAQGVTILMVTHDIEFAACHADRCGFLSQGMLVSADTPSRFFSQNSFYTTAISRMTRGVFENTVTVSDAAALLLQNGRREQVLP